MHCNFENTSTPARNSGKLGNRVSRYFCACTHAGASTDTRINGTCTFVRPTSKDEKKSFVEICEEEKIIKTEAIAAEMLDTMYKLEHIAPSECFIFQDEVLPKQWTRRIRTLERAADKVPYTSLL